jgi:hypothetical protein
MLLLATPSWAQKVTIDYAHDFDFESTKTFLYVDSPGTNPSDQLLSNRIVDAIKRELVEAELTEVSEGGPEPDLVITYHVTTQENQSLTSTTMGAGGPHAMAMGRGGRGAGWGAWGGGVGMATTTTRVHTSLEGTLIVDAYDPVTEQLVWRGSGVVNVKDKPEKRTKQIDSILSKLGKRWDKILHGKGK